MPKKGVLREKKMHTLKCVKQYSKSANGEGEKKQLQQPENPRETNKQTSP
jgi:hypothetical protein